MADKRVCEGYEVIKSHRVGKVEVVLAYNPNPKVPQQYVTWKAYWPWASLLACTSSPKI